MTKAAIITLVFVFCAGATSLLQPQVRAQRTPAATAEEEAVRRQANIRELGKRLEEAKKAQAAGDLVLASQLYEQAASLIESVGVGVDAQRQVMVEGMATVRLQLAKNAQQLGNLAEADAQASRVLRLDPNNAQALAFKRENDRLIERQRGKVPSQEVLSRVPEIKAERDRSSTLVQDARVLIEMGKLNEAEEKLRQAVLEVPENTAAYYYLALIKETRYQQEARKREVSSREAMVEVERAWNTPITRDLLPLANPWTRTNLVNTGPGRQRIASKLDRIILDEVNYDALPLSEVVKELTDESRRRDPEQQGINFIINSSVDQPPPPVTFGGVDPTTGQPLPPPAPPEPVDLNTVTISLQLRNVRLADVIDAITKVAERPLKYSLEEYAVVFTQRGTDQPQLFSRTFKVDPNTFWEGLEAVSAQSVGVASQTGGGGGVGGGGGGFGGGVGGGTGGGFFVPRVDLTGGLNAQASGGLGGGFGGGFGGGVGGVGGGVGGVGGVPVSVV